MERLNGCSRTARAFTCRSIGRDRDQRRDRRDVHGHFRGDSAREARARSDAPKFAWAAHLTNSVLKPYLVETPAKFSKAIRAQGLGEARVEVVQLLPYPVLPEYALAKWEVSLDQGRALFFGEVLASIENEIPLGQLRSLVIQHQAASRDTAITLAYDTLVQP